MEKYKLYLRHIIPFFIMILSIVISVFSLYNNPSIIYEYDNDYNGLYVKEVRGNLKSYTIPDTVSNIPVIGIGVRAFFGHSDLEEVKFEKIENIIYIERLAFSECEKLKTIDLRYVKEIGRNAFSYDTSLDNIELGTKYILGSTFYKCNSLKNLKLNEGVEAIGTYAFAYTKIEELRLPLSITTIYDDGLKYMNLNKLYVPNGFMSNNIDFLKEKIIRY